MQLGILAWSQYMGWASLREASAEPRTMSTARRERHDTLPALLLRSDIHWTELHDGELQADFGTSLPVHSRIQRFWFDTKTGLLHETTTRRWLRQTAPKRRTSSLLTATPTAFPIRPSAA